MGNKGTLSIIQKIHDDSSVRNCNSRGSQSTSTTFAIIKAKQLHGIFSYMFICLIEG